MSGSFERASSSSGEAMSSSSTQQQQANLRKDGRRMSNTGPGEAYSTSQSREIKENRRPLSAVLSEDHISQQHQHHHSNRQMAAATTTTTTTTTQQTPQRQSLLSKLTHHHSYNKNEGKDSNLQQQQQQMGTECDTKATTRLDQQQQQQTNNNRTSNTNTNTTTTATTSTKSNHNKQTGGHPSNSDHKQQVNRLNDEEEDDDNQVVPQWPSRSDAFAFKSGPIQHQVYSLKDYSQVSNPTVAAQVVTPPSGSSSSGKLLKSMSQDRKIKSNTKRLSECIYTRPSGSMPTSGHNQASASQVAATTGGGSGKQRTPSIAAGQMGSASFSMGPAFSVNSLLASGGSATSGSVVAGSSSSASARHSPFLGESRMDRMKKLFASPLSLKSNKMAAAESAATHRGATANPRLSLQSGSSMFNKPHHHLMHAVYGTRTGSGVGGAQGQHNRRSPLRQKQGKSFRVYGCPLQMANNIYPITCFGRPDIYKQQAVPYILARLCNYIEENSSALTHEGIFRVSGNARLMEKLRTLFDRLGDAPLELESVDVATSASMLKMYLRELPEPLIPTRMNYYFIALAKKYATHLAKDMAAGYRFETSNTSVSEILSDSQASIERHRTAFLRDLTKLVRKLPIENYNLLKYLACFLFRISLKQQYNKMCAEALGIVFGPNIFRIRSESYKGLREQELSNQIMASIIGNYKSIFDCELTDPLGNLVDSSESERFIGDCAGEKLSLGKGTKNSSSGKQPKPGQVETSSESILSGNKQAGEHLHNVASIPKTPTPQAVVPLTTTAATAPSASGAVTTAPSSSTIPLQSCSTGNMNSRVLHHRPLNHTCCPTHCRGYKYKSCHDRQLRRRRRRKHSCGNDTSTLHASESKRERPVARPSACATSARHQGQEIEYEDEDEAEEEEEEAEIMARRVRDCGDNEMDDEDEGGDDDGDDSSEDEDCNEEESYTPSSASESCYSVSGSDTLESSYEDNEHYGDDDVDDEDDEEEDDGGEDVDDENVDMASGSSMSGCGGSDTSYTPSSSPTESEGEGVSMEDEIERSSSPISNSSLVDALVLGGSGNPHACYVCKRRESAQAELLMTRNTNASITTCDTTTAAASAAVAPAVALTLRAPTVRSGGANKIPPNVSVVGQHHSSNQQVVASASDSIPLVGAAAAAPADHSGYHHQHGRGSSRRKRTQEGSSKKSLAHHTAYQLAVIESASRGATSDTAAEDRATRTKHYNEARATGVAVGGPTAGSSKMNRKYDSLRRRSSSASSLNRIKHKHERMIAAHRKHSDSGGQHANRTSRASRRTGGGRGGESSSKNRSSRRSRQKNHANTSKLDAHISTRSARKFCERSDQHFLGDKNSTAADHPDIYQVTKGLSALHIPDHLDVDLDSDKLAVDSLAGMDIYAPEYLEDHEGERYYLLRSFNSDETLLRSVNYCLESTPDSRCLKSRRRFSGYDIEHQLGSKPEAALLSSVRPHQFDQIPEALDQNEEIHSHEAPLLMGQQKQSTTNRKHQQQQSQADQQTSPQPSMVAANQAAGLAAFGSSIISLLDHQQMSNFRRSQMSINELASLHATENPIQVQMRSMKELIRALKRQLKHGSGGFGFSKTMERILVKMSQQDSGVATTTTTTKAATATTTGAATDLLDYSDDCSTCYIDYLSAHNLARQIEEDLELFESGGGVPSTSNTGLANLLSVKITLFKQRYNDLENIYDHCSNNHSSANHPHNQIPMRATQQQHEDLELGSESNQIESVATAVTDKTAAVPRPGAGSESCKYGSLCPIEFVFNIEKQLAMKRALGNRVVRLHQMTIEQLQAEKLELQKNLLRYEHWFGRPVTRLEFSFVGHLYERYRAVKIIKSRKMRQLEAAATA